jgi:hypothetical protein
VVLSLLAIGFFKERSRDFKGTRKKIKSLEGCTWLQFFSGDFLVRKDPKAVIPH